MAKKSCIEEVMYAILFAQPIRLSELSPYGARAWDIQDRRRVFYFQPNKKGLPQCSSVTTGRRSWRLFYSVLPNVSMDKTSSVDPLDTPGNCWQYLLTITNDRRILQMITLADSPKAPNKKVEIWTKKFIKKYRPALKELAKK